jgi:hypothetical protein
MDSRCSNAVTALALVIASGGAFFASPARAGDRIEFSAPAIPLAIPQPEVEIKESKKTISPEDVSAGISEGAEMGGSQQYIITKSKHNEDNAWDLNPLGDEGQNRRSADDWFTSLPEQNRLSNSSSLNMQRAWDGTSPDNLLRQRNNAGREIGPDGLRSGPDTLRGGQEESKLGQKNGYDQEDAKERDRYGREVSNDKENGFWSKSLSSDSSATDRFSTSKFMSYMDESATLSGGSYEKRASISAFAADSTHDAALLSGIGNDLPVDDGRSFQAGLPIDEQAGASPELRAWDATASGLSPTRSDFNPVQNSPSRVVAPNRPVVLPMPKRPGDPF